MRKEHYNNNPVHLDGQEISNLSRMAESAQMVVDFHPEVPFSIPSNGKVHMMSLQTNEILPLYEYYAVPKLDSDAFLLARIPEWSQYNFLPGKVNIFFRNNYVGTSHLNPSSVTDTISVSLGRDKNVIIKRRSLKDFTNSTFLSSDVEHARAYSITARSYICKVDYAHYRGANTYRFRRQRSG